MPAIVMTTIARLVPTTAELLIAAFSQLEGMGEAFGFSLLGESNPGCGKLRASNGVDVPSCAAWRGRERHRHCDSRQRGAVVDDRGNDRLLHPIAARREGRSDGSATVRVNEERN